MWKIRNICCTIYYDTRVKYTMYVVEKLYYDTWVNNVLWQMCKICNTCSTMCYDTCVKYATYAVQKLYYETWVKTVLCSTKIVLWHTFKNCIMTRVKTRNICSTITVVRSYNNYLLLEIVLYNCIRCMCWHMCICRKLDHTNMYAHGYVHVCVCMYMYVCKCVSHVYM